MTITRKEKLGEFLKQMYIYDIKKNHVAKRAKVSGPAVSMFFSMRLTSQNIWYAIIDLIAEAKEKRYGK